MMTVEGLSLTIKTSNPIGLATEIMFYLDTLEGWEDAIIHRECNDLGSFQYFKSSDSSEMIEFIISGKELDLTSHSELISEIKEFVLKLSRFDVSI